MPYDVVWQELSIACNSCKIIPLKLGADNYTAVSGVNIIDKYVDVFQFEFYGKVCLMDKYRTFRRWNGQRHFMYVFSLTKNI